MLLSFTLLRPNPSSSSGDCLYPGSFGVDEVVPRDLSPIGLSTGFNPGLPTWKYEDGPVPRKMSTPIDTSSVSLRKKPFFRPPSRDTDGVTELLFPCFFELGKGGKYLLEERLGFYIEAVSRSIKTTFITRDDRNRGCLGGSRHDKKECVKGEDESGSRTGRGS